MFFFKLLTQVPEIYDKYIIMAVFEHLFFFISCPKTFTTGLIQAGVLYDMWKVGNRGFKTHSGLQVSKK